MGYGTVPMLTIKPMKAATGVIMTYTLKANDTYTYTRYANALVGPYVTDIPLAVSAVGDGEVSAAGILPILNPAGRFPALWSLIPAKRLWIGVTDFACAADG